MRRQVTWFAGAVLLGVLGGAAAAGLDQAAVIGEVSAADHEVEEGYFALGDGTTLVARPGTELHRWLSSHRGQKVRLAIEGIRDGMSGDRSFRPGLSRDTGQISHR